MKSAFWRRLSLALGLILCLAASPLHAAEGSDRWEAQADPVFRNLLRDAALPSTMTVTAMAQDRQGFIWIGTQSGLVRWDGYRHRTYVEDSHTAGALADGYVTSLLMDPRGQLWIGTSAGGLARFDREHDRFATVPAGPAGLSHASVFALIDDGASGLWVGTGSGLDHLAGDGVTVQRHADVMQAQGLPEVAVLSLLRDRSGGLWVGTRKGLFRRPDGSPRFERVALGGRADSAPLINQLMQDSAGRVWIGTRPHGAFVVDPGERAARPVREAGSKELASDSVFGLIEVSEGRVWIGTTSGILDLNTRSGQSRRLRHHDMVSGSLPDNDVGMFYRDSSGIVWVGSDSGLSAHDPAQRAVRTWFGFPGNAGGLSHTNVPYVLALPDGRVWASLGDGGVDILDPQRGRIGHLPVDPARPNTALPKGRVLAMALSPTGVYLGTQEGLYHADAQGGQLRRLTVPGREPGAATWALCADGDRLWVGGTDGLWDLRLPRAGPAQLISRHDAASLGEQRVTSLYLAPGGLLWVGTRAGLARYEVATGRVERPLQDAPGRVGLPRGYITTVLHDRLGRLWVASFGGGVRIVEPPVNGGAPTIVRLGTAEGLPNNAVNAMALDGHGDVWVSTDDGVARVAARDLAVTPLRAADGVGIRTYWANSAAVVASGELLFGGAGGLTIINPDGLKPWRYDAPVVVTQAQVGDGPVVAGPLATAALADLTLASGRRDLSVEFSALDYSAPQSNRYAYRLAGFDEDWIGSDPTRRLARYTNLPPGRYTLELRGSNREGQWSEPLRWPVTVRAAWFETGWFRLAVGVLALALVAALVQGRTLVLRRRQQALEDLVAQRTAKLGESEARLQQLAYFDELTGLLNRRRFNEEFGQLQARARRGEPFALLLIDLDRFKQLNDTQGHDAGDALLVAVAERLTGAVRDVDRVARLGGDEFAVLLAGAVERGPVEAICRRIFEHLALPVPYRAGVLRVTASMGIATCPNDADSAAELYKAADLALYSAKHAGRDDWRWYEPALRAVPAAMDNAVLDGGER